MEKKKTCVVLFSGGQDSTTCLAVASKQFKPLALSISYNQKHLIEIECAKEICKDWKIPHEILVLDELIQAVSKSELTNGGDDFSMSEENNLPKSFVPYRNQLFLTMAMMRCQKLGAHDLFIGVSQEDYSGYPDCREAFLKYIVETSYLGSEYPLTIHAPLMFKTKEQTFAMANDLGILSTILNKTHTCYNGSREFNEWGYGCGGGLLYLRTPFRELSYRVLCSKKRNDRVDVHFRESAVGV